MKISPEIREKILTAVQSLVAQGNSDPTNEQVREYLGGGSLSHISPVMREWRGSRKSAVAAAHDIPDELKHMITIALSQVWTTAGRLAGADTEAVRKAADNLIAVAETERDEAFMEIDRLESEVHELKKNLGNRDEMILQAEDTRRELVGQITSLQTDKAALTAILSEKEALVIRIGEELKEARESYKTLQDELISIARKKGG